MKWMNEWMNDKRTDVYEGPVHVCFPPGEIPQWLRKPEAISLFWNKEKISKILSWETKVKSPLS